MIEKSKKNIYVSKKKKKEYKSYDVFRGGACLTVFTTCHTIRFLAHVCTKAIHS